MAPRDRTLPTAALPPDTSPSQSVFRGTAKKRCGTTDRRLENPPRFPPEQPIDPAQTACCAAATGNAAFLWRGSAEQHSAVRAKPPPAMRLSWKHRHRLAPEPLHRSARPAPRPYSPAPGLNLRTPLKMQEGPFADAAS